MLKLLIQHQKAELESIRTRPGRQMWAQCRGTVSNNWSSLPWDAVIWKHPPEDWTIFRGWSLQDQSSKDDPEIPLEEFHCMFSRNKLKVKWETNCQERKIGFKTSRDLIFFLIKAICLKILLLSSLLLLGKKS